MSDLVFAVNAVAPSFTIVFLGVLLRRRGFIDDDFVRKASQIVFRFSLPALVISKTMTNGLSVDGGIALLIFVVWTFTFFAGAWVIAAILR